MEKEISGFYGSRKTPCIVFVVNGWYCCEGSVNVNKTSQVFKLVDGVNVEELIDVDCYSSQQPINSLQQLKKFLEE